MTASRRAWIGLAVLALPTLLVSIDVFVMLLALPHLSVDLGASGTQQLWITDGYGFMVAAWLIPMGTLADRIGRRRLLLIGAAVFGVASVGAALAPNPVVLIGARGVLGIAGATLTPSTLALIATLFPDPRRRAVAIGVWMACFMGGAVIGPTVGGVMLDHFWWGSVFLLGVPAMVLLLILGPVFLPRPAASGMGSVDLTSVLLCLGTILPAVYGLKELARGGGGAVPLLAIAAGIAVGSRFIARQRTLDHPLLDLRLFHNRAFSTALGAMFTGTLLTGAMMLFNSQQLQLVDGLSSVRAGLCMLPPAGASTVSFLLSPHLARRIRPATLIAGGLAIAVLGLVVLMLAGTTIPGPAAIMLGFALVSLGSGPLVTLSTDIVVGSAAPERAGSAAAANEASGELGFALGIALLGSLGTLVYRATLPAGAPGRAYDSLAEAAALGDPSVLVAARDAYLTGYHVVAAVSAVLLAVVAVLVALRLRHLPARTGQAAADAHREPALMT